MKNIKPNYYRIAHDFEKRQNFFVRDLGLFCVSPDMVEASGAKDVSKQSWITFTKYVRSNRSILIPQSKQLYIDRQKKLEEINTAAHWRKYLDILEVLPEFQDLIQQHRQEHNIDPNIIREMIIKFLSLDDLEETLWFLDDFIGNSNNVEYVEELAAKHERLQKSAIKLKIFQNTIPKASLTPSTELVDKFSIPTIALPWIRDYIIYGVKRGLISMLRKHTEPQTLWDVDSNGTPYLTIKVYAHTDLGKLKSVDFIDRLQALQATMKTEEQHMTKPNKLFKRQLAPITIGHTSNTAQDMKATESESIKRDVMERQLVYYDLIVNKKCTLQEANQKLYELGFDAIPSKQSLKEINRFREYIN